MKNNILIDITSKYGKNILPSECWRNPSMKNGNQISGQQRIKSQTINNKQCLIIGILITCSMNNNTMFPIATSI